MVREEVQGLVAIRSTLDDLKVAVYMGKKLIYPAIPIVALSS